jgi:choline dehydrogenase-like flavoprotein
MPEPSAGNTMVAVPSGRGVGGSTLINSAICFRTPPEVLVDWRDSFGCEAFTDERMEHQFERLWPMLGVIENPPGVQGENNKVFREGAEKLGLPGAWLPRNAPGCSGCGVCQLGCPTGGKASVDRTLFGAAYVTGNVAVHECCRAEAVETKGDGVVALTGSQLDPETDEPVGTFRVTADRFVVACGALGSPRFLLKNGLAEAHCGQHLHLHPAAGVVARFTRPIEPWRGVTQGYWVDRQEEGYILQTYLLTPDQYYLSLQHRIGSPLNSLIADLRYLGSAGPLVHDEDSKGSVGLRGLTYVLGQGDRRKLILGLRETARVFLAAGATDVFPNVAEGQPIRNDADIAVRLPFSRPARDLYVYASHPMGTCRMHADPSEGVVDPMGRVHGWANLHVADASIFPTSLGLNPQITVMSVAMTLGEAIAAA